MNPKILFIDADREMLAAIRADLNNQFSFDTASDGHEALELLKTQGPYALALAGTNLANMNGPELLEKAFTISPDTAWILLNNETTQLWAQSALRSRQVCLLLDTPFVPAALVAALASGLKHYEMRRMEKDLLEGTLLGSVRMLAEVLGLIAPEALGRGLRLRESMRIFARFLDASPVWEMEAAALLASIGSISVPPYLLQKAGHGGDSTAEEEQMLRPIPRIGHDLLANIPRMEGVARIILLQRTAFAGSDPAAPECTGENLPIGARMLKILTDRMTLESEGVLKEQALETMGSRTGEYDSRLLALCFKCFPDFLANNVSSEIPVHLLSLAHLSVGQTVVSEITTNDGHFLVGSGNRVTALVLQLLHNYQALGQLRDPVFVQNTLRNGFAGRSAREKPSKLHPDTRANLPSRNPKRKTVGKT